MVLLDRTYPEPAENLACDEALLLACDAGYDALRFWEPERHFVVLGYTNRLADEVNAEACRSLHIPLFRRYSGGGTVLQGPGCLNYTLVLRIPASGPTSTISGTTQFILERNLSALQGLLRDRIAISGSSDLAINGMKFSGNAQRRTRHALMFHGTFLLDFDIDLVERVLRLPSNQPRYRAGRTHRDFLRNIPLRSDAVRTALRDAWHATQEADDIPPDTLRKLARERYADPGWTHRR